MTCWLYPRAKEGLMTFDKLVKRPLIDQIVGVILLQNRRMNKKDVRVGLSLQEGTLTGMAEGREAEAWESHRGQCYQFRMSKSVANLKRRVQSANAVEGFNGERQAWSIISYSTSSVSSQDTRLCICHMYFGRYLPILKQWVARRAVFKADERSATLKIYWGQLWQSKHCIVML